MKIEKPIEVRALRSGVANEVWLLRGANASYVFKWLNHSDCLGLRRSDEFHLQQQLADVGLAPEVIALDPSRWVLQEYISATPISAKPIKTTEKLRITAQALAQIHRQKPAWQGTTLWQKADHYAHRLGETEQQQLAAFKKTLTTDEPQVLCHFDLAFAHILTGHSLKVIDWEYAGWGDRLTDIASTIEINGLDANGCAQLCHHYSEQTGIEIDNHCLHEHRQFVRWLYRQWSKLLQQGALSE